MYRLLNRIKLSWPLVVLLIAYGYLAYHSLGGSLGVFKWADYSDRSAELKEQIANLQTKRQIMELRAKQLRASNLDLDRLDEEARAKLNVSDANDIVIWLDENP